MTLSCADRSVTFVNLSPNDWRTLGNLSATDSRLVGDKAPIDNHLIADQSQIGRRYIAYIPAHSVGPLHPLFCNKKIGIDHCNSEWTYIQPKLSLRRQLIGFSPEYNDIGFGQGHGLDVSSWGLLVNSFNWGGFVKDLYKLFFSFLVTYVPHPHLS